MITDEQKNLLLQQYYDRGILKKEIRSYEVSLWTLQDEFMTVLKWSDVEQRGRIENPKLTLNVDGTQKFTFSIPMYYRENGILRENPNWYTVKNGTLIMGLRKIKIIFNKGSEYNAVTLEEQAKIRSENTFELLITRVTENHEEDQLTCEVECEGLAFHELGKVGYKLSLSQDEFILDKTEWDEEGHWTNYNNEICDTEPQENVQYWCEEGCHLARVPSDRSQMESTRWYYDIQMNWGSFQSQMERDSDKVYEEDYVSSWTDDMRPAAYELYREKLRPVDASESNIYNITQTIAEIFGIYCKYVYGYDDNYHIISREIIFYNNYLNENNLMSFVYPYTTNQVSREMDATDVVTKMFIRPQANDAVVGGQINIESSPSNGMKEDYLLNFDYLYNIGAITKEQYEYIPLYEVQMRNFNIQLENLSNQINAQEQIRIDQSALKTIYERSVALDAERLDYNTELYKKLADSDGKRDQYFTRGPLEPYSTYIRKDTKGRYYIPLNSQDKGIIPNKIRIYRFFSSARGTYKNRIYSDEYQIIEDEYGSPSEISLINFEENFILQENSIIFDHTHWKEIEVQDPQPVVGSTSDSLLVYLIYQYQPVLYFDKINEIWINKKHKDQEDLDAARDAVQAAENQLKILNKEYETILHQKNELVAKFERMMGAALREGYWQPENYNDYGDNKVNKTTLYSDFNKNIITNNFQVTDSDRDVLAVWDNEPFNDENKNYYEESVLREKVYYPCIKVNNTIMSKISAWLNAGKTPAFIFNNNYFKTLDTAKEEDKLVENVTIFSLGSQMQLGFVAHTYTSTIIPVLILTGAESMTKDQIDFMCRRSAGASNGGNPRLGIVSTKIVEKESEVQQDVSYSVAVIDIENGYINLEASSIIDPFLETSKEYFSVYPRLRLCSTDLNTESVVISYNNKLLNNYEDYAILSRNVISGVNTQVANFEYIITIKPQVLFKDGNLLNEFNVAYTLSNAATCIYLDALQVMVDSSKPRASYTVNINALNAEYMNTLYKNLAQLVMINDTELKFENTFGYISQLELDLDAPWEDSIEVKNYKTKFEDLFTTIVASSENMRQNAANFEAAANGRIPLSHEALVSMVASNTNILQGYLDTGIGDSAYLKAMLADIFTEASAILVMSNDTLNDLQSVTLKNAEILGGFVENISSQLTPRVFNSREQPERYKVGDIWNEIDENGRVIGRHVATSSSSDSFHGFTKTYDGTLAQIRGAGMNVDAATGTVEIFARNQIDLKSGGNIYIAANDRVDIVGNREVNIGGTTINIAAEPTNNTVGGINIIATRYDNVTNAATDMDNTSSDIFAKVLIHPDKIELGSADILMRGSNKIQMITSRNTLESTSAISLSPDNGIWIGSGAGITLYSGYVNLEYDEDHKEYIIASGSGASVEMMPDHLLFGVSNIAKNNSNATAVKMTDDCIILATGGQIYSLDNVADWQGQYAYKINDIVTYNSKIYMCKKAHTSTSMFEDNKWQEYGVTGTSLGLIGAKFTKNSIGFAIESSEGINAILMDNNGISLGSGVNGVDLTKGIADLGDTYVRISAKGVDIGSTGHLTINTTNFRLNSEATESTPMLGIYSSNGTVKNLVYTPKDGLYIHGNIINDKMAFITSNGYKINENDEETYNPGIYVTDTNIQETGAAIERLESGQMVSYYEWHYNGKTYYCTKNSGNSFTVDGDKVLTYKSNIYAVAPRYAPKPTTKSYSDLYTYTVYYITKDNNGTLLKVDGDPIQYDGSSDPQINNTWYQKIPENQRSTYAIEYTSETNELIDVSTSMNGKKLERNLDVTFSVIANSGLTTIKTGQLGNFFVGPSGLTSGSIANGVISNTQLNSCLIENKYNTGYYGRCFYDYSFSRDKGILTLKRIDGKSETIDIATAIKVILEGGQTNDASVPTNSSGSGGTSGCSDCTAACASSCSGECTGSCSNQCVTSCSGGCKGKCKTGCTSNCTASCSAACKGSTENTSTCGGMTCSSVCANDCVDGCERICTASCTSLCKGNTEGGSSCGSSTCSSRCMNDCVGNAN